MSEQNWEKLQNVVTTLEDMIEEIEEFVEDNIPSKGDVEEDCQRLCIINAIRKLERTVNGLEESDLEPSSDDEEDEDLDDDDDDWDEDEDEDKAKAERDELQKNNPDSKFEVWKTPLI